MDRVLKVSGQHMAKREKVLQSFETRRQKLFNAMERANQDLLTLGDEQNDAMSAIDEEFTKLMLEAREADLAEEAEARAEPEPTTKKARKVKK